MRLFGSGTVRDGVLTSIVFAGAATCAFMPLALLFWMMQPKVMANPKLQVPPVARYSYPEPPPRDAESAEAFAQPTPVRQFTKADVQLRSDPHGLRQAQARAAPRKRVVAKAPVESRVVRTPNGAAPLTLSRSTLPSQPRSDTLSSL